MTKVLVIKRIKIQRTEISNKKTMRKYALK